MPTMESASHLTQNSKEVFQVIRIWNIYNFILKKQNRIDEVVEGITRKQIGDFMMANQIRVILPALKLMVLENHGLVTTNNGIYFLTFQRV